MRLLLLALILPVSLLPMPILHGLSWLLSALIHRVLGYRVRVVRENLRRAFPAKSETELRRLESAFYLHLCDLMVESLKSFSISLREFKKRVVFKTPEEAKRLGALNLAGISSHYGNWEWCGLGLAMEVPQIAFGVYKPLNSPAWNKLFLKSRQRFGIRMIPIRQVREAVTESFDRPILLGLLSDQAPHDYEKAFEVDFLGQRTYVTPGPAVITIQRGYTPIWGWMRKRGRSRYEWGIEEIRLSEAAIEEASRDQAQIERIARVHALTPAQAAYGLALTREYSRRLELQIEMAPQFWLWSHRRWKSRS